MPHFGALLPKKPSFVPKPKAPTSGGARLPDRAAVAIALVRSVALQPCMPIIACRSLSCQLFDVMALATVALVSGVVEMFALGKPKPGIGTRGKVGGSDGGEVLSASDTASTLTRMRLRS